MLKIIIFKVLLMDDILLNFNNELPLYFQFKPRVPQGFALWAAEHKPVRSFSPESA